MRIWWPWRSKKSLLLFEKRVPWRYEGPNDGPPALPREIPYRGPHPMNASGPFYVENQECTACGAPHAVAPALMGWTQAPETHPGNTHCYFKKQPEGPEEVEEALDAIRVSCCGAVRYCGRDPEIVEKLREAECGDAIDR